MFRLCIIRFFGLMLRSDFFSPSFFFSYSIQYCVIYGWSSFDYSRNALVKKNVCDASKDKVLYWENHYPTEMYFLADPEGSEEDDGVLVSVSFDGELEKSYLLLLDAKNFKEIDRAYLPINIPYPLSHGMHFPNAKFTV